MATTTAAICPPAATDQQARCWRCGKLLFELATRPWRLICPRCKARNASADPPAGPPAPRPEVRFKAGELQRR
jgi:phage FluMu protein Com